MTDTGVRLAQIADELRAAAQSGLHHNGDDEYDRVRFETVRRLAAELLAMADTRPAVEIERIFRGELGYRTPLVGADAAIFDVQGRILLAERRDSATWCMPGGAAEVGESASAAAVREALEETGLRVRAVRLIGLYSNRGFPTPSAAAVHLYHMVFQCDLIDGELTTCNEISDLRWVHEPEAVALPLFSGHRYKVPDAFRLYREPGAPAVFH